jgi:hypothetical protein
LRDQTRFPDTRLASDDHERGMAPREAATRGMQRLEFAISADEGRTGYRSSVHGSPECGGESCFVHSRSFPPYRTIVRFSEKT